MALTLINIIDKFNNQHYIFWTGGFDSTFSIMYFLHYSKNNIQPIYIKNNCVDGIRSLFGYCNGRQNKIKELETMNKIRNQLSPNFASRLLPTIFIDDLKLDDDILQSSNISYKNGLGTRRVNQYTYIAQVCKNFNINGIVSVIYQQGDSWNKNILPEIKNVNSSEAYSTKFELYSRMRFPLINFTKRELYNISKLLNFNNILEITWSCWIPIDGKPCNKCNMCKERIIK